MPSRKAGFNKTHPRKRCEVSVCRQSGGRTETLNDFSWADSWIKFCMALSIRLTVTYYNNNYVAEGAQRAREHCEAMRHNCLLSESERSIASGGVHPLPGRAGTPGMKLKLRFPIVYIFLGVMNIKISSFK